MTNNGTSTTDEYFVELVVRPVRRQPHQGAYTGLVPLQRESNQGVLNGEALQKLLRELHTLSGKKCIDSGHECVRVHVDETEPSAPYISVIFQSECFSGPEGGMDIRHLATNLLNTHRAFTYATTHPL